MVRHLVSPALAIYVLPAVLVALLPLTNLSGSSAGDWNPRVFYIESVSQVVGHRQFPFWNPWQCGGNVLWQNPRVPLISAAYPFHLLLPLPLAIKLDVVVHFALALLALHLLGRRIAGASSPLTMFSWVFVLAGALAFHMTGDRPDLLPLFLLPLVGYFALRGATDTFGHTATAAVVLAAGILGGSLLMALVGAILLGLLALVPRIAPGTKKPLITAIVVLVAACGLAAPRLVPYVRLQMNDPLVQLDGPAQGDCRDPIQVRKTATAGRPMVSASDGPLHLFDTTESPNRVVARVTAGHLPARLVLNQNFASGWRSNVGAVVPDPLSGNPSVIVPAGYAGRVSFTFVPRGLWLGLTFFLVTSVALAVIWLRPAVAERVLDRLYEQAVRRGAALAVHPRTAEFTVLAVAVLGSLWMYAHYRWRPTLPDNGWWGFWDQSVYLRSARAFAVGNLSPDEHWYPIGYPLLAVPFVTLMPVDPFLLVNILLFALFAWSFFHLFRPILGAWVAAAAFFAAVLFPTRILTPHDVTFPIWSQFVVPWNTHPIAGLYIGALIALRSNWEARRPLMDFLLGAMLGLVVCVRPSDAVPLFAIMAIYAGHTLLRQRRIMPSLLITAGTLLFAVPGLAFMLYANAGGSSPYLPASAKIGFEFSNLHERTYQMLLRSEDTYGELHTALFQVQPWLYLAVPLALAWAVCQPAVGALPVGLVLLSWALYLSYNEFSPYNMLRFFLVHYITWTLPVVAAAGIAGARDIVKHRRWLAAATVLLIAAGSSAIRLTPSLVKTSELREDARVCCAIDYTLSFESPEDLDAIDVPGLAYANRISLSWKTVNLVVDGREFDRLSGYQLVPVEQGIRIIFTRNVSARRITFTLDETFLGLRQATAPVRPIRFDASFGR